MIDTAEKKKLQFHRCSIVITAEYNLILFFLHTCLFFFQEGHEYYIRIFAKNEIGFSDPLENDEPTKVVRPPGKQYNKQLSGTEQQIARHYYRLDCPKHKCINPYPGWQSPPLIICLE